MSEHVTSGKETKAERKARETRERKHATRESQLQKQKTREVDKREQLHAEEIAKIKAIEETKRIRQEEERIRAEAMERRARVQEQLDIRFNMFLDELPDIVRLFQPDIPITKKHLEINPSIRQIFKTLIMGIKRLEKESNLDQIDPLLYQEMLFWNQSLCVRDCHMANDYSTGVIAVANPENGELVCMVVSFEGVDNIVLCEPISYWMAQHLIHEEHAVFVGDPMPPYDPIATANAIRQAKAAAAEEQRVAYQEYYEEVIVPYREELAAGDRE